MSEHNDTRLPKPTSFDELFPGRFLKAGLFKGKNVTLTITSVDREDLPGDKGDERRGILSFKETPMQLVVNKTNGLCLRAMFGTQVQTWVGKRVTFSPEKDKFGRETVDAIRIAGSPDLTEAIDVEIKMPRKKARTRSLTVTAAGTRKQSAPTTDDQREPDPDNDGR